MRHSLWWHGKRLSQTGHSLIWKVGKCDWCLCVEIKFTRWHYLVRVYCIQRLQTFCTTGMTETAWKLKMAGSKYWESRHFEEWCRTYIYISICFGIYLFDWNSYEVDAVQASMKCKLPWNACSTFKLKRIIDIMSVFMWIGQMLCGIRGYHIKLTCSFVLSHCHVYQNMNSSHLLIVYQTSCSHPYG